MSTSDLQEAQQAILWFQAYFTHQPQHQTTQILANRHIKKLKYFVAKNKAVNSGVVEAAKSMHFSLEEIIRKLEDIAE
jgi:hypothetical protein